MFNALDYVGISVDKAEKLLKDKGYDVNVTITDGGKIDKFDSVLVTNAVLNDGTVELTATKFLLNI